MEDSLDTVHRMFRRLVKSLDAAAPEAVAAPLTIADLYQQLVPYRLVRAELGFSELKEYEHALLRLLAGEGGYLAVDTDEVAEEFLRELASPNPILGIYRDYAAIGVALTGDAAEPLPMLHTTPVAASAPPLAPAAAAPAPRPAPAPPAPAAPSPPAASRCWSCGELLPSDRAARYCPVCGAAQAPLPCAACGVELEPRWRFCAECGCRRAAGAPNDRAG